METDFGLHLALIIAIQSLGHSIMLIIEFQLIQITLYQKVLEIGCKRLQQ